jgi:carboxymethylenebutenolidase
MKEGIVSITTDGGAVDTFVTCPSEGGPFPPVFIFMDIWGLREELFDVARRIATVGYFGVVPNLYYRQGDVRNEFRNAKGQMITLDALSAEQKARVLAPLDKLTDDMVVADIAGILKFLDGNPNVKHGAAGSVGYCMGGRYVFRAAANFPDRFKASASLHGTDLVIDGKDSPHLQMSKALGEVYCGFGEKDRHTPPSTVETLNRTFAAMGVGHARYINEVHRGAEHGYALPDRDVFDKQSANRDWEIIFAMFRRELNDI